MLCELEVCSSGCGEGSPDPQFRCRDLMVDYVVTTAYAGRDHEDDLRLVCGTFRSKEGRAQDELIGKLAGRV